MSETASMNPNVPVGAEAQTASKANSQVTFDDISDTGNVQKPKPKLVKDDEKKPAKEKAPVRSGAKDEASDFDGADDEGEKKPAAKPKGEKDEEKGEKPAPKAKPKVHKVKAGENMIDIPGDAIIEVPVNGKMEQMSFEDFRSQVSGKINWDKKNNEFHKEKTEWGKQKDSLNTLVSSLYEKSQKDPEAAWDFLAELTKQDPAQLKLGMLKKQFEEMMPLFQMEPDERERWFKERELDYRDKAHANRAKADTERETQAQQEQQRSEVAAKFGIDEAGYDRASKTVHAYLSKTDPKFDGKVTPEQVIYADRHLMALEVIGKTVPQLENHEKFDSIVGDIVNDLIRHPGMNREKLGSLLQDVWGDEDKKGLKNLARKAAKNAQISDDEKPIRRTDRRDPVTFDDLD